MTITNLGHASLKTASKNAIVATATQLLGSDVSVTFANADIKQANKNGIKGSSFTGLMSLSITADVTDFPQFGNDECLKANLFTQLLNLVEVNAVYQAKAWQFKASELTLSVVTAFGGIFDSSACVATKVPTTAPSAAPTIAPTNAPTTVPSAAPTIAPTDAPTTAPSVAPTIAPTEAPTVAVTDASVSAPPTSIPCCPPELFAIGQCGGLSSCGQGSGGFGDDTGGLDRRLRGTGTVEKK